MKKIRIFETGWNGTPIVPMQENVGENDFWIKRDDMIPFSFGGNKARKACEFYRDIKEKNTDLTMLGASVIAKDPLDLFSGFSVDLGELDGVSIGDPVITGDGLVGWVSKVYNTTASVTTIFSPETHIGATSKDKNETGIIESDIKLSDKGLVKLSYLKTDTALTNGDIITTTGLSGKFPKNIVIGKVVSIEQNSIDVSKYAHIEPYMNISELSEVFIVTDFYGKGEISSDTQSSSSSEE